MTHHINLSVREHAEKRLTLHREAAKQYSEATGDREVTKFTGPWVAVLEYGVSAVGGDKNEYSITVELERLEGGIGELTITEEKYRVAVGEDSNSDSGSADDSDGSGESEEHPSYTMSSSLTQVSILAHPKFKKIKYDSNEGRALKALLDGQDLESLISVPGGEKPKEVTIKSCLGSDEAKKAAKYICKGITYWLEVHTEATARWKGGNNPYTPGEVYGSIPGFPSGKNRNWLCSGVGKEKSGSVKYCTASFRLSGEDGWDSFLYGNG